VWLRGFEQAADAGLVWDLLVYDEQLSATHNLITSFPDTTFVLEGLGWPLDLSTEGFSRWEERFRRRRVLPAAPETPTRKAGPSDSVGLTGGTIVSHHHHTARDRNNRSHTHGKTVVPSPWQATAPAATSSTRSAVLAAAPQRPERSGLPGG
jgi:hypothetical protein